MLMIWICVQLRLPCFFVQCCRVDWNDAARDASCPMIWLVVVKDRPRWGKPSATIQRPACAGYLETHSAPPFSQSRIEVTQISKETFAVRIRWSDLRTRIHSFGRVPMNGLSPFNLARCALGEMRPDLACCARLRHCTPPVFLLVSARRAKGASTDASAPATSQGGA